MDLVRNKKHLLMRKIPQIPEKINTLSNYRRFFINLKTTLVNNLVFHKYF